jgi:hypothetical protein
MDAHPVKKYGCTSSNSRISYQKSPVTLFPSRVGNLGFPDVLDVAVVVFDGRMAVKNVAGAFFGCHASAREERLPGRWQFHVVTIICLLDDSHGRRNMESDYKLEDGVSNRGLGRPFNSSCLSDIFIVNVIVEGLPLRKWSRLRSVAVLKQGLDGGPVPSPHLEIARLPAVSESAGTWSIGLLVG